MRSPTPHLDDLRKEIDRIDESIVALMIERREIVRTVAAVKGDLADGRVALRPAREAAIMRRLVALAGDRFPRAPLVRMWRELVAALTRVQTPLSVAVHVPPSVPGYWDIARDHFGSFTPVKRFDTSSQALRAVGDGADSVAVLPMPHEDDPWWRALLSGGDQRLRVIARLPFGAPGWGCGDDLSALVVGRLEEEPSGDDISLLAIESVVDVSRARLRDVLHGVGLEPRWLAAWREPGTAHTQHLIEVDGFIDTGEARLSQAQSAARGEILRLLRVGVYARPLAAADLT